MAFARGHKAVGMCDRCGFKYRLHDLREEWTGLLVCRTCFDLKHPLLDPYPLAGESIAIKNPRPDQDVDDDDPVTLLDTVVTMTFGSSSGSATT